VHRVIKGSVERVLASSPVTSFTRRRLRGKSIILAYHAVTPHADRQRAAGERSLYVPQRRFAAHLDILRDVADVVALDQLDAAGETGARRPRVAITFDDAYQGAVTCAIDELESRGLPATIFVAPGCLGGQVFWWDALSHAAGEMPEEVRARALHEFSGIGDSILRWASDAGIRVSTDLPPHARSATVEELLAASARRGITLGSHSWSHANLAKLGRTELDAELMRSAKWLADHEPARFIPRLAYPYGLEAPATRVAAASAGYVSAFCIAGGWHDPARVPPFARPRLNVGAGMSLDGFRARLLGSRST
jgi:peptidoglycan/xylan/chitin deacetylase (PgdA/CDA1 family)